MFDSNIYTEIASGSGQGSVCLAVELEYYTKWINMDMIISINELAAPLENQMFKGCFDV